MPSPNLLEWCSASITSLHNTVHEIINNFTKTEIETSPYLSAIQSLKGTTPGEKFKELNAIISSIVEDAKERGEFTDCRTFREVSPSLTGLIRAAVGDQLRLGDLVAEGLASDDAGAVNRALAADWYMSAIATEPDKLERLLRRVSARARNAMAKRLGRALRGCEARAEGLFDCLADLYGVDFALPALAACSGDFVYEAALRRRIGLPAKFVRELYAREPEAAIRYLQLGNWENPGNAEDRKRLEIRLHDYDALLPLLVRGHPRDFQQFYRLMPEKVLKLSNARSTMFLRNCREVLIAEPRIFLKILPLSLVTRTLDKAQFDTMYLNLFPEDLNEFNVAEMISHLEHYFYGDKYQLLSSSYERVYHKALLENESCARSMKLLRILPAKERERRALNLVNRRDLELPEPSEAYSSLLPAGECLRLLRERMPRCREAEERARLLGYMVDACRDQDDLLAVLEYYNERHVNEQSSVLSYFLEHLKENGLDRLRSQHWSVLKNILLAAYVRNELFEVQLSLLESVLESALRHAVVDRGKNLSDNSVEKLVELTVEFRVEECSPRWNVLTDQPELEKLCIEEFFRWIPLKFPQSHKFWKNKNSRIALALSIARTIDDYNKRNVYSKKFEDKQDAEAKLIKFEDYPWILKLTEEFFSRSEVSERKKRLMTLLRKNAPDFYEKKMNANSTIRDIESGEALSLLRRDSGKILADWPDYLAEAREKLVDGKRSVRRAARRFVAATRHYHDIPVKFVERSVIDIKEPGSFLVLGLLLEGPALERLVETYAPGDIHLDIESGDARLLLETRRAVVLAAGLTEPPVSLGFLATYCRGGDFARTTIDGTLDRVTHRQPTELVLQFAVRMLGRSAPEKRRALRLLRRNATREQLRQHAERLWSSETERQTRQLVERTILEIFAESPSSSSWEMTRTCIEGLTAEDEETIERFADIENVEASFLTRYIELYLGKLEKLCIESGLSFAVRTKCVCLVFDCLDAKLTLHLSGEVCSYLLRRYLFDCDSLEISRAARNFALRSYLLPAEEAFEQRFQVIMDILKSIVAQFDIAHPKRPRYYAANYTLREFFEDTLTELAHADCGKERVRAIVDGLLEIFSIALSPCQEPLSYLALRLYREYLRSESPREFGEVAGRRLTSLVEDFNANESIVDDIADCLNDLAFSKIFKERGRSCSLPERLAVKISLIEGLLRVDDFYATLVAAKMLHPEEIWTYDERYDEIIKKLRQVKNEAVQYSLYKHLNRAKLDSDVLNSSYGSAVL